MITTITKSDNTVTPTSTYNHEWLGLMSPLSVLAEFISGVVNVFSLVDSVVDVL